LKKIPVLIGERTDAAKDVVRLVLRRPNGESLPAFSAGAHLDLFLANGLTRQYSLTNDGREPDRYEIAVSRALNSRGGSSYVHEMLCPGVALEVSEPRNNFALQPGHETIFFVAGGIGITPIRSMIRHCERQGFKWRLLYLARSRERAAFYAELETFGTGRVHFHFDDEAGNVFDFTDPAFVLEAGVPIYCCGPAPVMNAVGEIASRHPDCPVYFEWFAAPSITADSPSSTGFDVKLDRSGRVLHVSEDKSILQVLEEHGYELPCSCREGMCRTCETKIVEGVPDHRDYVLSQRERDAGQTMMICVSRAKSPVLILDL
jgi:tetrachlorobenzoquinone reductase